MKQPSLTTQANRQGWIVLGSAQVFGDGAQAPGFVTLCKVDGGFPFAVHFFNSQDGGFHEGTYCDTYQKAAARFCENVLRFTRHHTFALTNRKEG